MADFDAYKTARDLATEAKQIMDLEHHKQQDKLANGPHDTELQQEVSAKMHMEVDQIYRNPEQLRAVLLAGRNLPSDLPEMSNTTWGKDDHIDGLWFTERGRVDGMAVNAYLDGLPGWKPTQISVFPNGLLGAATELPPKYPKPDSKQQIFMTM